MPRSCSIQSCRPPKREETSMPALITLTTDFGEGTYVPQVRGVILRYRLGGHDA